MMLLAMPNVKKTCVIILCILIYHGISPFQCFDEAVARQHGMKDDVHVAAYATYEMGVMLSQSSTEHHKGKVYLMRAKVH